MIKYSQKGEMKMKQRSYTAEYRADAVKLASEIGGSAAARQLKIPSDTVYYWIARAKRGDLPLSEELPDPKVSLSMAEENKELKKELKMIKSELAQTKRENQILEEATAFFVKRRKK